MNKKKILFVVEGPDERKELRHKLLEFMSLDEDNCTIITYQTTIHELYDLLMKEENEGISLTSILIKQNFVKVEPNFQIDSTFSSTYLIFDFDAQYHKYSKNHLSYLIERFNNDSEEGLLFLNYPMFESLFHIPDLNNGETYMDLKVPPLSSKEYKKLVKKEGLKGENNHPYSHINDFNLFKNIARFNLNKYLKITGTPKYLGMDTKLLFDKEQESLETNNLIYVLNSLVLLYYEYNEE